MIRAVLDTNVLVSAIIADGTPAALVRSGRRGAFEIVVSGYILEEARRVLTGKLRFEVADVDPVLLALARRAHVVPILHPSGTWCDDPADDAVIETALAGEAAFLVTGDRRLLATHVPGLRVCTVREFADELRP